jgi:hypothetical protein
MEYFDYQSAAREAKLTPEQLRQICDVVKRDYPVDQMMYELHVLRVCRAIAEGRLTFDRATASPAPEAA